jgi:hypothetical protein
MHGGRSKTRGEPGMDTDHIAFFIVGGAVIVLAAPYRSKAK